jgi:hypothetical protein
MAVHSETCAQIGERLAALTKTLYEIDGKECPILSARHGVL